MADCFTSWDAIYAQRMIEGNTEVWGKHNRIKLKQKQIRKSCNENRQIAIKIDQNKKITEVFNDQKDKFTSPFLTRLQ